MEVLKISDSKFKLMLDQDDMEKYGLNYDNIDYNKPEVKRSFWKILDSIKESHGFDAEGDKLLIQFYPSRDGGCELFVTKLGLLPPSAERAISKSNRVTLLRARRSLYRFSDFATVLRAIRAVGSKTVKSSDIFYDSCGDYYLEILERTSGGRGTEHAVLAEFAESLPQSFFPYISEHCKKITDGDALGRLSKFCIS